VKNLLVAFDNIGPAFCYGGVHRAVLQLYLGWVPADVAMFSSN